jgi:hypothetical protein
MSQNSNPETPFLNECQQSLDVLEPSEGSAKTFQCPCCNARIQFKTSTRIVAVEAVLPSGESVEQKPKVNPKFTDEEAAIIERARESGILKNFADALSQTSNVPKDAEKYFLTFLKLAQRKDYPQFGLRMALPKGDGGGKLEAWVCQEITLITSDGYFKQFIPTKLVRGETLESLSANGGIQKKQMTLDMWVRTGFGYVKGKGLLFKELRSARSHGGFARASN